MKFCLIFVFMLSFHSCKENSDSTSEKNKLEPTEEKNNLDSLKPIATDSRSTSTNTIEFRDEKLGKIVFTGLTKTDFSIEKKGDTIFLQKKGYLGLENAKIEFESDRRHETLKTRILYGVSQMTFDDIPGPNFLKFTMTDTIFVSKDSQGQFEIGKHIKDFSKLVSVFQAEYFNRIRDESYQYQSDFYQTKSKDTSLTECCPEYLDQAEEFLHKKKNDFKTLDDLHVVPQYKKVVLEFENNTWFVFYNYSKAYL